MLLYKYHDDSLRKVERFTIVIFNELVSHSLCNGLFKGYWPYKTCLINGRIVDGVCTKLLDPNRAYGKTFSSHRSNHIKTFADQKAY